MNLLACAMLEDATSDIGDEHAIGFTTSSDGISWAPGKRFTSLPEGGYR